MPVVRNNGNPRPLFRTAPSSAFDQYLLDIQKLPMITDPEEEKRLARRAQAGDATAAERLVTANLRFVISYVKKYQGHGLELSELVAIGNEGLLKAVRKFDPEHGVKFISYAVWWVRQAVLKALAEQTRSVRIPLNQNSALIRMSRAESFLAQELGREPTDHEVALALNDTVDNIRAARRMTGAEVSLDAPVERQDRASSTFGERVAGTGHGEIEEMTDSRLRRRQGARALVELLDEADVIRRRIVQDPSNDEPGAPDDQNVGAPIGQLLVGLNLRGAADRARVRCFAVPSWSHDAEARLAGEAVRKHLPVPGLEDVQWKRRAREKDHLEREEREGVRGHGVR